MNFITRIFRSRQGPDYKQLVGKGAVIIDVRSAAEFSAGHIPGSINIPLDILPKNVAELKEYRNGIITCCRSGLRSGIAKTILYSAGITAINGGAWNILNKKINP